jgi:hypothetical protein
MLDDNLDQIRGDLDMQVVTQWQIEDHLRQIRDNQAACTPGSSNAQPRKIGRLGGNEIKRRGLIWQVVFWIAIYWYVLAPILGLPRPFMH